MDTIEWTPDIHSVKPEGPEVGIVASTFLNWQSSQKGLQQLEALCCFAHSIRAQRYDNWRLLLVHDGPIDLDTDLQVIKDLVKSDSRMSFKHTPTRANQFGHNLRHKFACELDVPYLLMTNSDNYYVPTFLAWMVSGLVKYSADLVMCDMLHSHRSYKTIKTQPARGFVDIGNWIAASNLVKSTQWQDFSFAGDWSFFSSLYSKARKTVHIPTALFVHN